MGNKMGGWMLDGWDGWMNEAGSLGWQGQEEIICPITVKFVRRAGMRTSSPTPPQLHFHAISCNNNSFFIRFKPETGK